MFLKELKIINGQDVIRSIPFHNGLNLIVDETPFNGKDSGNNVGKTTVLKLIDFCLGGDGKDIYTDSENPKKQYQFVKDFLVNNNIIVELILINSFNIPHSYEIKIRRNFITQKGKQLREINGEKFFNQQDFEIALSKRLFPGLLNNKPTFRQVISHSIRIDEQRITNILRTLDKYSSEIEYETLYLYMFNCALDIGEEKLKCVTNLSQNIAFKNRLENKGTRNELNTILSIVKAQIEDKNLDNKKIEKTNIANVLNELNNVKYQINKISNNYTKLKIRLDMIIDAEKSLSNNLSKIDLNEVKIIYEQASQVLGKMQKSFEEIVGYHNKMIKEKIKFITSDKDDILLEIKSNEEKLINLNSKKIELENIIREKDAYKEIQEQIIELNKLHERKGELESSIDQIDAIASDIERDKNTLIALEQTQFSEEFKNKLGKQLEKFNIIFSSISKELYNESYGINYEIGHHKKTDVDYYKFSDINATSFSTGKKQGSILCFDIAYILFARQERIDCLNFILNDKKELMHGNQLDKVEEYISGKNIQIVYSILQDKLSTKLRNDKYICVKLSQSDKLFRI